MVILLTVYLLVAAAAVVFLSTKHKFDRHRDSIPQRILVIGSEDQLVGASVSALLRAAGIRTYSRTSQPSRLTLPDGNEAKIERTKPLHTFDWSRMVRSFAVRRANAVVYSQSAAGKGLRGRLELLFFRPNIVIVTGDNPVMPAHISGATIIAAPKHTAVLRSLAKHLQLKVADLRRFASKTAVPRSSAEPTMTYTTRTRVRQRLHAIIDKLDNAGPASPAA